MLPAIETAPESEIYPSLFISLKPFCGHCSRLPFRVDNAILRSCNRVPAPLLERHNQRLYDSRCIAGGHDLFNNCSRTVRSLSFS